MPGARLSTHWSGVALIDGDRVLAVRPFGSDAEAIADRLHRIARGEILDEERELATRVNTVLVAERRLLALGNARLLDPPVWTPPPAPLAGDPRLLHASALALARRRVRETSGEPDKHVVEAVNAMDDLIHVANILSERFREWYALHAPELVRAIPDHESLARAVAATPQREDAETTLGVASSASMGAPLGEREAKAVAAFAALARDAFQTWRALGSHVDAAMAAVAPNLTGLVGPSVGARLLRHAGGLKRLASMPAGTVQTLGAEKALFRHLKEGNLPPKHGVIFQHPLIHQSPWWLRGRLARLLAGRIVLAARADAFTENTIFPQLTADLEREAASIRAARPRPPAGGGGRRRGPPPGRKGGRRA